MGWDAGNNVIAYVEYAFRAQGLSSVIFSVAFDRRKLATVLSIVTLWLFWLLRVAIPVCYEGNDRSSSRSGQRGGSAPLRSCE